MIRKGELNDAAAMAEIFNHYVRTSPVIFSNRELSAEEMKDKISHLGAGARFPFLIAEVDGRTVGYCYAHHWQPDPVYDRTWEVTIYLSEAARGRGIGTALLSRLVEECRVGGAHTLVSCITHGNRASERIHEKTGFELVGVVRQAGFKFGEYYSDAIYQLIF